MALSDEAQSHFAQLATQYVRGLRNFDSIDVGSLPAQLEAHFATALAGLDPADRSEALATLASVARRRIESMRRTTVVERPGMTVGRKPEDPQG